jgi:enhancing lycopene biosynthesis protein 2
MEKLLEDGSNLLTNVKSTDAIMVSSVLRAAKNKADAALKAASTTIAPTITSQSEAQDEADCLNMINQSVIGKKEGVVEAVTKLVGRDITNAVLQTADGSNHKSIDNFTLFAVMAAAINGADCLSTTNMLEQILEVIDHTFDF